MGRFPIPTDDANSDLQAQQLEQLFNLLESVGSPEPTANIYSLIGLLLSSNVAIGNPVQSPDLYTVLGRLVELITLSTATRDRLPSALSGGRLLVDAIAKHWTASTCARFAPTLTTASTGSFVSANANRKGLVLYNRGSVTIYLSYVNSLSATAHRHAVSAGGAITLYSVNEPWTGAWFGIAASGTAVLEAFELT